MGDRDPLDVNIAAVGIERVVGGGQGQGAVAAERSVADVLSFGSVELDGRERLVKAVEIEEGTGAFGTTSPGGAHPEFPVGWEAVVATEFQVGLRAEVREQVGLAGVGRGSIQGEAVDVSLRGAAAPEFQQAGAGDRAVEGDRPTGRERADASLRAADGDVAGDVGIQAVVIEEEGTTRAAGTPGSAAGESPGGGGGGAVGIGCGAPDHAACVGGDGGTGDRIVVIEVEPGIGLDGERAGVAGVVGLENHLPAVFGAGGGSGAFHVEGSATAQAAGDLDVPVDAGDIDDRSRGDIDSVGDEKLAGVGRQAGIAVEQLPAGEGHLTHQRPAVAFEEQAAAGVDR